MMVQPTKASSAKKFLLPILIFLIATNLSIFLDVPIFSQFLAFLFFTIVPGLLILYLLKLNKLGLTEKIVLSIGLSVSFLIFAGLLINWAYPLFGYNTPLSTSSLLISFSVITLLLAILVYLRNRNAFFAKLSDFRLDTREKALLLLPTLFLFLSILGTHLMNTTDNNVMLMALLFLIPAYAIFISIKHNQVPNRVYAPMIFLTSVSLVLLLGLRSNHIIGADAHFEYYLFQLTSQSGRWQIFMESTLDACLSISLLPTIYQSFLHIDSEYLFKILYPLFFSISPLVIYVIAKRHIGSFYAFLASLFFMAQGTFLWTAFNPRTVTAIFFFALAIMALFQDGISELNKKLLFIVFTASCIISHYSTTYIFFFVLLLTWLGTRVLPKLVPRKTKPVTSPRGPVRRESPVSPPARGTSFRSRTIAGRPVALEFHQLKKRFTITTVVLFLSMIIVWYSQLTKAPFDSGVRFVYETFANLSDFFFLESRGEMVQSAFGTGLLQKTIPQKIEFVFTWLTILLITIGILSTIMRSRRRPAIPNSGRKQSDFLPGKLDAEYVILSVACFATLASSVLFPLISTEYGMSRVYFQMMAPLAMFFVIGGITVYKDLKHLQPYWFILAVLIPYFMCTTGIMYQLFDIPRSMILNSKGDQYDIFYVHDQDNAAARWLLANVRLEGYTIYTDYAGNEKLLSQGGIPNDSTDENLLLEKDEEICGYIYLRYCNVVEDKLLDKQFE